MHAHRKSEMGPWRVDEKPDQDPQDPSGSKADGARTEKVEPEVDA